MKKTKKALASLAIAGMALTTVPFNALADNAVPNRLAGTTAEQTAVQIAEQMAPTSGIAILASSASYGASDALTAGPLAAYLKAPILLQGPDAALNADTKAELSKLNVKTVYVTSGTAVIKQSVLNELQGMGISVESLGGNDRFETSVNIAKKMVALGAPVKKVAVAYGWLNQDALSIAAIASAANEPILLTEKSALPASAKAFLADNGITSSDVIGGTGVIDASVMAELPSPTRHFGQTAYDTNNQVIQDFASSLKFDTVYLANGKTGIDALAGAPLAALTDSPIVLTDGADVPAAATFVHGKMSATGVVTALGGAAVVPDAVRTGVATGQVTAPAPQGALAVTSVAAASATSFNVVFNQAPADTSKIAFNVTNTGAPVTVTTTWDDAKTTATLSSSANFPEGTYSIDVKNDTTDLGSSNVDITAQKIAKITITSTKLAVLKTTTSSAVGGPGYFTYKVFDQYNNDITTSYLANNLTFTTAAGDATKQTPGVAEITNPTVNLMTLTTVAVQAYDATSGVSASASLAPSTALGTLSSITLNKLTNVNNVPLTAGDTSDTWYIDYTALDMSGNPTSDYNLVSQGLIYTSDDGSQQLTTSNNNVTAKVVKDPNDNNKAAIEVTVTKADTVTMDMPVSITAMSYQGSPSTLNTTLKKQGSIDTFTLMAPSQSIASGEYKQIPFVAYDQNGNQLTKFDDLFNGWDSNTDSYTSGSDSNKRITLSGGLEPVKNPDGTASLYVQANTVNGNQSVPQILTAVTPTGKLSSLTINVQKPAAADKLALDSSVLVTSMQEGAIEGLDFGYNYGGLNVTDNYGRAMDLDTISQTGVGNNYAVIATTTGGALSVSTVDSGYSTTASAIIDGAGNAGATPFAVSNAAVATNGFGIQIVANSSIGTNVNRTQTVNFYLVNKSALHDIYTAANPSNEAASKAIDSSSATFSVLKDTDISSYTIAAVKNPIYAFTPQLTTSGALTSQELDWAANPYVYGTTSGGGKVMLKPGSVQAAYVDDTSNFVTKMVSGSLYNDTNGFDSVKVVANDPADKSSAGKTTNLTVQVMGADNLLHTVVTPITSSTTLPVAKSLELHIDGTAGMHLSDDGNTLYIDNSTAMTNELFAGTSTTGTGTGALLQRNDADGTHNKRKDIYFYVKDSYGAKGLNLSSIQVIDYGTLADGSTKGKAGKTKLFDVDNGRVITNALTTKGDYATITAVTNNGLIKTIKIVKNY